MVAKVTPALGPPAHRRGRHAPTRLEFPPFITNSMRTLLLALPFLLPASLACQSGGVPTPALPPGASAIGRGAGLQVVDGVLVGAGDRYKVRFERRGFEFTPALGRRASRNHPLAVEVESIGRGATLLPLSDAAPAVHDLRVEYDRGVAVERYDVGGAAMEQSFVFAARPSGSGDLVVRARLSTDLEVAQDGDGLRFLLPGVGSFRIGGVTGIDANGERVSGGIRYADGFLELSLPADFVDRAALPFVLDPPYGGASQLNGPGGNDDEGPRVAYDLTRDTYLVVWTRIFSAADHDVHGQRVSRAPFPLAIGNRILIENTTAMETEPQVADCDGRNVFVVVHTRAGDVVARAVDASTGAVSASTVIAGGTAVQHAGCVATELNSNQVLCAWQSDDLSRNTVSACAVTVNANLTMTLGTVQTVAQGLGVTSPRMSKADRGTGRHAVAYLAPPLLVGSQVYLRIVDNLGAPITGVQAVLAPFSGPQTMPEVDGDGTTWTVAWNEVYSARRQVRYASYSFAPVTQQLVKNGNGIATGTFFFDLAPPSVTCIQDSCLLGFAIVDEARIDSVDPFRCIVCEDSYAIGIPSLIERTPFGCSVRAGGGATEDALVAWEQSDVATLNGDIIARSWNTLDGRSTSLGGGCGRGGSNHATCARSPSPQFAHRLRGALPNAPAVFLLAGTQSNYPCGPCNVVPDLATAITLVLSTDALGNVSLPIQIQAQSPLIGVPLLTQWATVDFSTPACTALPVHLSNALRVVIEA